MTQTTIQTHIAIGTFVRNLSHSGPIAHGSIGQVKGYHHVLTSCPVVYFSTDTFGPHDTFMVANPDVDLLPLDKRDVHVTEAGRYVFTPAQPCVNCAKVAGAHTVGERQNCERTYHASFRSLTWAAASGYGDLPMGD